MTKFAFSRLDKSLHTFRAVPQNYFLQLSKARLSDALCDRFLNMKAYLQFRSFIYILLTTSCITKTFLRESIVFLMNYKYYCELYEYYNEFYNRYIKKLRRQSDSYSVHNSAKKYTNHKSWKKIYAENF